ncbi:MAG: substrate-binding domain-containing protein, partial [Clostridia bacterium]
LNTIATYPTAWFCAGDRIAVALISLLQQKGLTVPGDISVIGYDDIPISQTIAPSLTTIRVNRKLMGMLAVERLIELQTDPYRIVHIGLPGTLIVRDSVRALQ